MSLVVNLAVLAEGAATDARGNLTLVAVNPQILIPDELPAQFSPIFVVVVQDDESEPSVIVAGRTVTARVEATGPDDAVVFFAQLRQAVLPTPHPTMYGRVQVIAQIPFTAGKAGNYTVSARVAIVGAREEVQGEVTATRSVKVADAASLRPKTALSDSEIDSQQA